jgi:enamine deaminase RidA (YjgF/YER057c/UK114 family)
MISGPVTTDMARVRQRKRDMVEGGITDIIDKPEFNRAWDEWVDRSNLPLRSCIGASLEQGDLVELVVTAAMG